MLKSCLRRFSDWGWNSLYREFHVFIWIIRTKNILFSVAVACKYSLLYKVNSGFYDKNNYRQGYLTCSHSDSFREESRWNSRKWVFVLSRIEVAGTQKIIFAFDYCRSRTILLLFEDPLYFRTFILAIFFWIFVDNVYIAHCRKRVAHFLSSVLRYIISYLLSIYNF